MIYPTARLAALMTLPNVVSVIVAVLCIITSVPLVLSLTAKNAAKEMYILVVTVYIPSRLLTANASSLAMLRAVSPAAAVILPNAASAEAILLSIMANVSPAISPTVRPAVTTTPSNAVIAKTHSL